MQYFIALVFALLLSAYYYHRPQPELSGQRRILLASLRLVMLFILFMILLSPILYFTRHYREAPKVLFLQDSSRSMELGRGGVTKKDFLKTISDPLKKKYSEAGYKVLSRRFADGLEGADSNSLLAKALRELSEKEKLSDYQAIILASDGWLRDEDLGIISRLGLPIHALADSSIIGIPDLEIVSVTANRYAYRNEPSVFRVRAKATGYEGTAVINLYLGDSRIGSQSVQLSPETEASVDFTHRFGNTGFYRYRVEIQPLEKEQRLGNNSLPGAIEVLSEKEHIMVFSDSPAWDNKFIVDAIATNPRWDSSAYQIRDGRLFRGENPATLDGAPNPAVIVLINNGNLRPDSATQGFIRRAIERGTGIYFQGLPPTELSDLLPIARSNITSSYQGFVTMISAANQYPMLGELITEAAKLPPLDYYYVSAAQNTEVLATMNNPQKSPAIVVSQSGKSRALGMSFLNLWRWQMQGHESGYQKMIVNSLTWLSNKALGSFSAIYKSSYLGGEEIRIRLRAEDDIRSENLDGNPQIVILNAEGKEVTKDFMIREGSEYSFVSELTEPGEYRFEISEGGNKSAGRFSIDSQQVEDRDFDYNLPLLQYITSESRGRMIYDAQSFSPIPAQATERIERNEFAMYRKWYIISLFILIFCVELFLRRRWGLL
jgi:hypothetical protein